MAKNRSLTSRFPGYTSPNYTPVPDTLFDEQLPDLTGAELKVLLYVCRRTFGFKREADNISLSQMLTGLRTRDGRVLDRGTGLTKKTLLGAIKSLEEKNILITERRRSVEKGDEPTTYRLNVRRDGAAHGPEEPEKTTPPVGEKVHQGGGGKIPPRAWGNFSPTQETERKTDSKNFELRKVSTNFDENQPSRPGQDRLVTPTFEQGSQRPPPRRNLNTQDARTPWGNAPAPRQPASTNHNAGYATLGELIEQRQSLTPPAEPAPRRGRPIGTVEERELVVAYLSDFAIELGDEAPLSSSVSRVLSIFKRAGVAQERWPDLLYQMRALTKEHSAQITKKPSDPTRSFTAKNRMPYALAVLESLVGLRADPAKPSP